MRQFRGNLKPDPRDEQWLTPQLVKTGAGDIEVAEFGNPNGPALILLPHGLGDWSSLNNIALDLDALKPDLRFVSLSRPGCGRTPCVREGISDPLFFEASNTVPALMDALGIEAAHLVGHADGASVALIFAGLFPDRALSVVGLSAYGFADEYLRAALESMSSLADGPQSLANFASVKDPETRFLRWREDRLWECATNWNATRFLRGVSIPFTFIQGARDELLSIDQAAAITACVQGEVCWITLQNAGHFVHLDNPQQIVMLIRRQLEQARGAVVPSVVTSDKTILRPTSKRSVPEVVRSSVPARPLLVQDEAPAWLFPA
ncbi:alpha/beta fold hydrolase [Ensifer soli]|uniref:alpha/beta fold hydrolase n=1 Tax=Ciceribacter sp. sgz301302 TaxID=3342379 RepID=UPI0035BA49E3